MQVKGSAYPMKLCFYCCSRVVFTIFLCVVSPDIFGVSVLELVPCAVHPRGCYQISEPECYECCHILISLTFSIFRLAGLLLLKLLPGVFPRERLSMARKVKVVHWLLLLVQRFPEGVFNLF